MLRRVKKSKIVIAMKTIVIWFLIALIQFITLVMDTLNVVIFGR